MLVCSAAARPAPSNRRSGSGRTPVECSAGGATAAAGLTVQQGRDGRRSMPRRSRGLVSSGLMVALPGLRQVMVAVAPSLEPPPVGRSAGGGAATLQQVPGVINAEVLRRRPEGWPRGTGSHRMGVGAEGSGLRVGHRRRSAVARSLRPPLGRSGRRLSPRQALCTQQLQTTSGWAAGPSDRCGLRHRNLEGGADGRGAPPACWCKNLLRPSVGCGCGPGAGDEQQRAGGSVRVWGRGGCSRAKKWEHAKRRGVGIVVLVLSYSFCLNHK